MAAAAVKPWTNPPAGALARSQARARREEREIWGGGTLEHSAAYIGTVSPPPLPPRCIYMRVPVRPARPSDPRQPTHGLDDGGDGDDGSGEDDPQAQALLPRVHVLADLGAGPSLGEHDYVDNLPPECMIARAEVDLETAKSCR